MPPTPTPSSPPIMLSVDAIAPVTAGSTAQLSATLTDAGLDPIPAPVIATVVLPSGVTLVGSLDPDVWTASSDGQVVTLTSFAPLAGGESRPFVLLLAIDSSASSSSIRVAVVSGPQAVAQLLVVSGGVPQVPVQLPTP
ncbi:MAG: hypothetical protein JO352_23095 [Chloroflexi bacterium]|nr:hypothetical protein [Chloroflexota bacterium]